MSFTYDYSLQEGAQPTAALASSASSGAGTGATPNVPLDHTANSASSAAGAPSNVPSTTPTPFIDGSVPGSAGSSIPSGGAGVDSKNTLWMGELEPWLDEVAIKKIWSVYGENVSVKLIRDKFSGAHAGYCFVEFANSAAAAKALSFNGQPIPNSQRVFKLNWASGGGLLDKRDDRGPEFSIFVGDLAPDVTEFALHQLFQSRYPSCKSAKIMTDPVTNTSRGYGFVRFSDDGEMQRALTEMQGFYCGSRPMRISTATPKNKSMGMPPMVNAMTGAPNGNVPGSPGFPNQQGGPGMYQMGMPSVGYYGSPQGVNQFTDPNNTTVFVGGLSGYVTGDELRSYFASFGDITYVKIPPGKGCGFVQFVQRQSAEAAITQMQGYPIGNSRVRLSWGRSQNSNGPPNTPYRPAPPPNVYPQMAMPAQAPYGSYGPINPQAAHVHPPGAPQQGQIALPQNGIPPQTGAAQTVPGQDPSEPIPVARLNELYLAARDGRLDRVEADGRGYHGVYAQ